jgi:DNA repair protein RecO (recombination protein O)
MYFLPLSGKLCCMECIKPEDRAGALELNKSVLAAMRHIIYSEFEKLFAFSLPPEELARLAAGANAIPMPNWNMILKPCSFTIR